jgi:hypothetical protein
MDIGVMDMGATDARVAPETGRLATMGDDTATVGTRAGIAESHRDDEEAEP